MVSRSYVENGMSKSSSVTARRHPPADALSVSGALRVHAETFTVDTAQRIEVVDLTDRIMKMVRTGTIREGIVHLFSTHTTCTLCVNEFQAALSVDFTTFLEQIVPGDASWRHNDPAHSDCDRMNADAHLRALLLGHSLSLQLSGGEVVLGQWQRILLAELDGPRARTLRLQVMGLE
jgi:secondary thiamine-phosphate synthase enzyme